MTNNEMFLTDLIPRYLKVVTPDGELLEEVWEESLELRESLCSEDMLRFGCCEASIFNLRILNVVTPLTGKKTTLYFMQGDENEMQLGEYRIYSDKPTADRRYRDIVAYDAMHDIINADVAEWYNTILPNDGSQVTLREFRTSFLAHFGIEQEEITLINDDMVIQRTVAPVQLSGRDVITAICEINGCFGHIGRDGKFQYIHLKEMVEGLYPSDTLYPSDDLYPADPLNAELISKSHYVSGSTKYEDFTTERINKLQIRQEEDDIGKIYPDTEASESDNCYIVQGNFLVYGKSSEELEQIAANLYSVISKVWYRPAHVEAKGNPCLEVGDGIRLATRYEIVYTYILQRTLKGIQALRDTYDAEGEQYQRTEVNGSHAEIQQLKGKTNKLTRTIEETRMEMEDNEKGLSNRIAINTAGIEAEIKRALGQEAELTAAIAINTDNILAEVARATGEEEKLSGRIAIASDEIAAEVSRATLAEGNLSAGINVVAGEVALKASKNNIIAEINLTSDTAKIQAARIDLVGLVSADEFVSKFATITTLNALEAYVERIDADYASVGYVNAEFATITSLDSVEARINTVQADYVTTSQLNAVDGKFNNLNADNITAGTLSVDRVDLDGLASKVIEVNTLVASMRVSAPYINAPTMYCEEFNGKGVSWTDITINGTTYTVLTA